MLYLIEYVSEGVSSHDVVGGWDEKDALLNFYEKHKTLHYYIYDVALLNKMLKNLSIIECVYVLNYMISKDMRINGIYKNLEHVYGGEDSAS